MDLRSYALCASTFVLVATSLVYGLKFLGQRNYLLGVEWLVITFSATNFLVYLLSGAQASYTISYFCDAFSRGFGIPVIAIAGLMTVTHRYRPSILVDVWFFVVGFVAALMLVASDSAIKPYFYVAMWAAFTIYLVYLAKRLLDAGKRMHALRVAVALTPSLVVACIYDFYKIPGDDLNVLMNFYFLAGLSWAYLLLELYYAYRALDGAQPAELLLQGA
jgi:hypothetical protein